MQKLTCFTLAMALALSLGCGNDDKPTNPPLMQPESTPAEYMEDVVITIGNLSDLTGVGATTLEYINMALDDLVEYYNSENLIPGIELEVITYDGQFDPSRDIPGYEWLKERGADLIFTAIPDTPLTLKSIVDKENMPLFAASGYQEMLDPPGYVFVMGPIPEHQAYTFLSWIAENDWDYESNGPAKIGGASWAEGYSESFMAGMKEYSEAHPDQFE